MQKHTPELYRTRATAQKTASPAMQSWGVFVISMYMFSTIQGILLRYGAPVQFLKAVASLVAVGCASCILTAYGDRYTSDQVVVWFTIVMSSAEATCLANVSDAVALALGVYLCKPHVMLRNAPFARALIVYRLISTYGRGLVHMYHALLRANVDDTEMLETLRVVARSVMALSFLANAVIYIENMKRLLEHDVYLILHVALFTLVMGFALVRGDVLLYRTLT